MMKRGRRGLGRGKRLGRGVIRGEGVARMGCGGSSC